MKRALDIGIFGFQPCVAAIDHARIVTEPDCDFVEAHPVAGQQAREGVAHGMDRYPGRALRFAVFFEGPGEIVAVAILAVLDLRLEHVGLAKTVCAQETLKLSCHRDGAFLAIFEIHRGGATQMNETGSQIEPERAGFDDLLLAKSGVKSAVENEAEVFASCSGDQVIALIFAAEISEGDAGVFIGCLVDSDARISSNGVGHVHAPLEKGSEDREVTVRGRGGMLMKVHFVERLQVVGSHVGGRELVGPTSERFQDESAAVSARDGEVVLSAFVSEERVNLCFEGVCGSKRGSNSDLGCPGDRLGIIAGFQADVVDFPAPRELQPIDFASPINAAAGSIPFHGGDCNLRTVTFVNLIFRNIAGILRNEERAGDETRTRDVLLGKVVAYRGNCNLSRCNGGAL